jgi:hypothetical protein
MRRRGIFSPAAEVAEGGHGSGVRSVTTAALPALLGWRWKKLARPVGLKTRSGRCSGLSRLG